MLLLWQDLLSSYENPRCHVLHVNIQCGTGLAAIPVPDCISFRSHGPNGALQRRRTYSKGCLAKLCSASRWTVGRVLGSAAMLLRSSRAAWAIALGRIAGA